MALGESPFWGTSARCHPISTVPHVVGARLARPKKALFRHETIFVGSEHGCAPFAVQAGAQSVSQPPVPEGLLSCSLPVMINSILNHDG
jgi:hypothetical protein